MLGTVNITHRHSWNQDTARESKNIHHDRHKRIYWWGGVANLFWHVTTTLRLDWSLMSVVKTNCLLLLTSLYHIIIDISYVLKINNIELTHLHMSRNITKKYGKNLCVLPSYRHIGASQICRAVACPIVERSNLTVPPVRGLCLYRLSCLQIASKPGTRLQGGVR